MPSNIYPQTDTSHFQLKEILYTNETDLYRSPLPPHKKKNALVRHNYEINSQMYEEKVIHIM